MKYYVEIGNAYSARNKLHEAIHASIAKFKRFVFTPADLPAIQSALVETVKMHNAQFPRCKAIEAKWETDRYPEALKKETKGHKDYMLILTGEIYSYYAIRLIICREREDL